MAKPKVAWALLDECATWTPLKGHYNKVRSAHHRMLLLILEAWRKSPYKCILAYKDALKRTGCGSIEETVHTRRLLRSGALLRMGNHRLPMRVMAGELKNARQYGPVGKEKRWAACVAENRRVLGITGDWTPLY